MELSSFHLTVEGLMIIIFSCFLFFVRENIKKNFSAELELQKNNFTRELEKLKAGVSLVGDEIKDKLSIYREIRNTLSKVKESTSTLFYEVNQATFDEFVRDYKAAQVAVYKGKFKFNEPFMDQAEIALKALKKYKDGKGNLLYNHSFHNLYDVDTLSDKNEKEMEKFDKAFNKITEEYRKREQQQLTINDLLSN